MFTVQDIPMKRDVELSSAEVIHKITPKSDELVTLILKVVSIDEPKNSIYSSLKIMRVKFEGGDNTIVWGTVYGKNWIEAFPERTHVGAVVKIIFRALPPYSRYVETSNVKFEIHINDFGGIRSIEEIC